MIDWLRRRERSIGPAVSPSPGVASPAVLNARGVDCAMRGDLVEAHAWFMRAVATDESNAEAWTNLGNVCRDLGDLEASEAHFARALAARPDVPLCHVNHAAVLLDLGRYEESEERCRQALAISPSAGAWNALGIALRRQGRIDEARAAFEDALRCSPAFAEARVNLADVHVEQRAFDEAERNLDEAMSMRPGFPDALNTRAVLRERQRRLDDAEADARAALRNDARHHGAMTTLGIVATKAGRYEEAETHFRRALALKPAHAPSRFNLAMLLLLVGRYGEGWGLYESRFDAFTHAYAGSRRLYLALQPVPRWHGERLDGERVHVWCEQGLGDALMAMRFLPGVKARGAGRLTVGAPESLRRVLASVPGVDEVIPVDDVEGAVDCERHCPMMSLPGALRVQADAIPTGIPYLVPEPSTVSSWSERIRTDPRKRVGLVWAGSPTLRDDAQRSVTIAQLGPLFAVPNVRWISLQKGGAAAELRTAIQPFDDWMDECRDLMDTASLVENLDLVISVDTAVAHLAGALGKPVWLLNRHGSEWRWGIDGETTGWYPTMRVFRQREAGDWAPVVRDIAARLAA